MNKLGIDLTKLNYKFSQKPLVIGGKAMEYYGLRKAGKDIDLVVSKKDLFELLKMYPKHKKDLFGDIGVCVYGFEIWQTICLFDYHELGEKAEDLGEFKMVSLEKLLFLKTLGIKKEKYRKDIDLILKKIFEIKYNKKIAKKWFNG